MSALAEIIEQVDEEQGPPTIAEVLGKPDATTQLAARVRNLILTAFPELKDHTATGIQRPVAPGFRFEFHEGFLIVDDALEKSFKQFLGRYGKHYFFDDEGVGEAIDLGALGWLRGHERYGFGSALDGFVEIGNSAPASSAAMDLIVDAVLRSDAEQLAEIAEAEGNGWKREDVLAAAARALDHFATQPAQAPPEPPAPPAGAQPYFVQPGDALEAFAGRVVNVAGGPRLIQVQEAPGG